MPPTVSAVFVSYGHGALLGRAIRPVFSARTCNVEAVVVNNQPSEDVAGALPADLRDRVRIVEMGENAGFCRAANRGIEETAGDFVFLVNPDLFMADDHVDALVELFSRRPRAGCASGKILREDGGYPGSNEVIDTAGIAIGRNRRGVDRGEGLADDGTRYAAEEEVFAASGAAFFARRAALEDVSDDGQVLDETFFMYKEELDLSWRLRLRGWECWYVPAARARHIRGSRGLGGRSYMAAARDFHRAQRAKPQASRVCSLRNQWLVLVKNEDRSSFARHAHLILARELAVLAWTAVFSPRTLVAVREFRARLPAAREKRRAAHARRLVRPAELRRWFGRG